MSCCVGTRRAKSPAALHRFARLEAKRKTDAEQLSVMGTWDYKWPLGTRIRVAFQRPPGVEDDEFEGAQQLVQGIAERWRTPKADIAFDFASAKQYDLEPPDDKPQGRHPHRRSRLTQLDWPEYDVLVSLEPLPVTIVDTLSPDGASERIFLPFSQLGSYARRIDYGTPTIFIGPVDPSVDLRDHYRTRLAQTMVLHEFGHVLGLAHEHQSPVARSHFNLDENSYDLGKVRRLLIERLGVPADEIPDGDATDEFLEAHLTQPWPGDRRFSDWRSHSQAGLDSVMAVPYHDCSLKLEVAERLGIRCSCAAQGGSCAAYEKALLTEPTKTDRHFLAAMYPRN